MSKKPKKKQTEWNVQGKQIADIAVPLYQTNLKNISNFNPQSTIDDYLNKYYGNTAYQNDFLRNYNRAMSGTTAQNYAATGGGYDTSNQRNYDDMQRYQNDLASRLQDYGVQSARGMADTDYNNLLKAQQVYQSAYALGQPYSDVDQYNYQVKQANKWYNQLGGLLGTAGAAVGGALGGGVGSTIGASLGNTLGGAFTVDFNGSPASTFPYANAGTNAILGYYNQQANLPASSNQSIRIGESSYNPAAGQYVNAQQATNNYFNNNLSANQLANSTLLENMKKRGLVN